MGNTNELYKYIDKEQLTVDYGGTMMYRHRSMVDFYQVSHRNSNLKLIANVISMFILQVFIFFPHFFIVK